MESLHCFMKRLWFLPNHRLGAAVMVDTSERKHVFDFVAILVKDIGVATQCRCIKRHLAEKHFANSF